MHKLPALRQICQYPLLSDVNGWIAYPRLTQEMLLRTGHGLSLSRAARPLPAGVVDRSRRETFIASPQACSAGADGGDVEQHACTSHYCLQ